MKKLIYVFGLFLAVGLLSACTNNNQGSANLDVNTGLNTSGNANLQTNNQIINQNSNIMANSNHVDLLKEYSQAKFKTSAGEIIVKLYNEDSPMTVNNFLNLAKDGFYNNTKFHRVIKDFMIQGGDPNSKEADTSLYGTGGPGYKFNDEINNRKLVAGSLAMANSGPNTNGSQFFIVTASETPWLDGAHTNFGEVVSGMDVVRFIEAIDTGERDIPVIPITIDSIELLK